MSTEVIRLQNVNIYQGSNMILHEVNLQINSGEFVYLIGKTGSGKSSLLKTLYGELPLTDGEGEVAGTDLRKLNRSKVHLLRRQLGIVFQDFQLLTDRTVAENLDFVLRSTGWKDAAKRKARIAEVLSMVGLATKDFKMPFELSGGEQQRVVVARALLNDPAIILADEPTGNLDPEVADDIMKLLKEISNKGTAVFMATHDYRLINKFFGKIYRCESGQIQATSSLHG
ncbi:MAG: ATP-binding cassette domain-containing protein [Bacteroidota bacterium]|nr:ATP-binding cassette domain-containing protein [Bacteroidota bacterium]MDX5429453.1 ATP-binding cassette domain-containing protein [Bacteroidota bacterium]MDX5468245.1 ATP-binding cassette domain-containing protein [Bacteroidota bacterium]